MITTDDAERERLSVPWDSTGTHQEGLVEFKGAGKLPLQLVNTVQPLQEDRAALVQVLRVLPVTAAVSKLVPKVQPLRLHQDLEALNDSGTL